MKKPFIPPPLPPQIEYNLIVKELGQAHHALGELKGSLINIPNLQLLVSPLLKKEAVLSSKIEGTQATLKDVFLYEAEEKTAEKTEIEKDIKEIINYLRAVDFAMEFLKQRPMGENLVKETHNVLLDSVRGANKDRGNFRRIQVHIGPPRSGIEEATYIPPPASEIPNLFSNWEKYLNSEQEKDVLVQIGVAHYQFEAIHPFLDGNGRIGRLLIPLFLYHKKLLPYPILYVSEYLEENREYYYASLKDVSESGQWERWLICFLQALTIQSLKTQIVVLNILNLYKKLKDEVSSLNSIYAVNLLDLIFSMPVVSFHNIQKHLKPKSNTTIFNVLRKFVDRGILKEISERKRNRVFAFEKLIEILSDSL